MRIEITKQIASILEKCPFGDVDCWRDDCFEHCPLAGACLEYFTGDNSENH